MSELEEQLEIFILDELEKIKQEAIKFRDSGKGTSTNLAFLTGQTLAYAEIMKFLESR